MADKILSDKGFNFAKKKISANGKSGSQSWQHSSMCCYMFKLHWDDVSSFSLAGPDFCMFNTLT